jgi:DNA-binding transcriptional regulator YdaS (Cro superfamily)
MATDPLTRVFEKCPRPLLAEKLGITLQAVVQWRRVPPARLSEVSKITGIPMKELRPDLAELLAGMQ